MWSVSAQLARGSFEKLGGVPAQSAADVGAQADIVFSCLPSTEALDDAMQGPNGLIKTARAGQIVVELGSHPVPDKKRQIAPLKEKGASFIDGEVSGTPGMVSARKGVIYLAGDAEACKQAERVVGRLCRFLSLFRRVRRREPGQADQQPSWSRSTSRRPRKRWRWGSRPALMCR